MNSGKIRVPRKTAPKLKQKATSEITENVKIENNGKWDDTVAKAMEIMATVAPKPEGDLQSAFLEMVTIITHMAKSPEDSKPYQDLRQQYEDSQRELGKMTEKCKDLTDEIDQMTSGTPNGRKSTLSRKLERLDAILAERITAERKLLGEQVEQSTTAPRINRSQRPAKKQQRDGLKLLSNTYREEFLNMTELSPNELEKSEKVKERTTEEKLQDLPFARRSPRKT